MKPIILIGLMAVLPVVVNADSIPGCEEHVKYGAPVKIQPNLQDGTVLCRLGYVLSHNPRHKVPDWVAYHLTADKVAGVFPRKDNFRADPELFEGERSELGDYKQSGYDRGHLAPAADMKWYPLAMDESFLLSNIAPQIGIGFNRGIWAKLEQNVRNWAAERGEVYIITGTVYDPSPMRTIGSNEVSVPTHFYKVVFDPIRVEAAAYLLPHKKLKRSDLSDFVTTVDKIEEISGFDFLSRLHDDVEQLVETKKTDPGW